MTRIKFRGSNKSFYTRSLVTLFVLFLVNEAVANDLGTPCQHDMDCTDFIKGSTCSNDGLCECAPYFVQFNRTTCLQSQLLGGDCQLADQCSMKVANSSCLDGACRCVEGFLQFRKHTCLGPAHPGAVCYSHGHCQMFDKRTHCDFLIPNLFGRCQCTAPAKQFRGTCISEEGAGENSVQQALVSTNAPIAAEVAVHVGSSSEHTASETTTPLSVLSQDIAQAIGSLSTEVTPIVMTTIRPAETASPIEDMDNFGNESPDDYPYKIDEEYTEETQNDTKRPGALSGYSENYNVNHYDPVAFEPEEEFIVPASYGGHIISSQKEAVSAPTIEEMQPIATVDSDRETSPSSETDNVHPNEEDVETANEDSEALITEQNLAEEEAETINEDSDDPVTEQISADSELPHSNEETANEASSDLIESILLNEVNENQISDTEMHHLDEHNKITNEDAEYEEKDKPTVEAELHQLNNVNDDKSTFDQVAEYEVDQSTEKEDSVNKSEIETLPQDTKNYTTLEPPHSETGNNNQNVESSKEHFEEDITTSKTSIQEEQDSYETITDAEHELNTTPEAEVDISNEDPDEEELISANNSDTISEVTTFSIVSGSDASAESSGSTTEAPAEVQTDAIADKIAINPEESYVPINKEDILSSQVLSNAEIDEIQPPAVDQTDIFVEETEIIPDEAHTPLTHDNTLSNTADDLEDEVDEESTTRYAEKSHEVVLQIEQQANEGTVQDSYIPTEEVVDDSLLPTEAIIDEVTESEAIEVHVSDQKEEADIEDEHSSTELAFEPEKDVNSNEALVSNNMNDRTEANAGEITITNDNEEQMGSGDSDYEISGNVVQHESNEHFEEEIIDNHTDAVEEEMGNQELTDTKSSGELETKQSPSIPAAEEDVRTEPPSVDYTELLSKYEEFEESHNRPSSVDLEIPSNIESTTLKDVNSEDATNYTDSAIVKEDLEEEVQSEDELTDATTSSPEYGDLQEFYSELQTLLPVTNANLAFHSDDTSEMLEVPHEDNDENSHKDEAITTQVSVNVNDEIIEAGSSTSAPFLIAEVIETTTDNNELEVGSATIKSDVLIGKELNRIQMTVSNDHKDEQTNYADETSVDEVTKSLPSVTEDTMELNANDDQTAVPDQSAGHDFSSDDSIVDIMQELIDSTFAPSRDLESATQASASTEGPVLTSEEKSQTAELMTEFKTEIVSRTEIPEDQKLVTFYPAIDPENLTVVKTETTETPPEVKTISPFDLPFDIPAETDRPELISANLVIINAIAPALPAERFPVTTAVPDIAELTTHTLAGLASRTTLMEPSAPVTTTLATLIRDDPTTTSRPITSESSEVFKATNEIRKRVELGDDAVSLGLPCVSNKQCQLADPHTYCNQAGRCECAYQGLEKECSAQKTGCSPGTFQCRSSGVCISWFFVCDGRPDCTDASDEECTFDTRSNSNQTCPAESFRCGRSDRCISRAALCDGRKQCPHGEDEIGCNALKTGKCPENTFRCKSGECLPEYEYCNAIISCKDGSDEPPHLCGSRSVPNFFLRLLTGSSTGGNNSINRYCPHRCSNGRCRSTAIVCSGRDGCGDGTDEETCSVCRCPAPIYGEAKFFPKSRPMPLW